MSKAPNSEQEATRRAPGGPGLAPFDGISRERSLETRRQRQADVQARFLEAVRRGLSIGKAADMAGVTRSMPDRWARDDPEFKARFTAAREDGLDACEDRLLKAAVAGEWKADLEILRAKRREIWGRYIEGDVRTVVSGSTSVAVSGSVEVSLSVTPSAWLEEVLGSGNEGEGPVALPE